MQDFTFNFKKDGEVVFVKTFTCQTEKYARKAAEELVKKSRGKYDVCEKA